MRFIIFAKRNFKEIVRDPLSLIFCLGFPLGLLLIFQLIIQGIGEEAMNATPQFRIDNLSISIAVFSYSFVTLFSGMIVSKDRTTSFLARLRTSPMKAKDFMLGYTLPLLPIIIVQTLLCFCLCFLFGLTPSIHLFVAFLILIPSALFFILLGLLLGTIFNDKAIGGIASIVINLGAILGGMFFPLRVMQGSLVTIAYMLPFANGIDAALFALQGDYSHILKPFLIILVYLVVLAVITIRVFHKKLQSEKN